MNTKRIWKKVFETKHNKCVFDIETSDGTKYENVDYSRVYIGTREPDPKERKVVKMTFHCHNCTNTSCSTHGKPDHSISDKDHTTKHTPDIHMPVNKHSGLLMKDTEYV